MTSTTRRSDMTLDLDALDALRHKCVIPDFSSNSSQQVRDHANLYEATFHALPELLRLARIGQRAERNAKETKCST